MESGARCSLASGPHSDAVKRDEPQREKTEKKTENPRAEEELAALRRKNSHKRKFPSKENKRKNEGEESTS